MALAGHTPAKPFSIDHILNGAHTASASSFAPAAGSSSSSSTLSVDQRDKGHPEWPATSHVTAPLAATHPHPHEAIFGNYHPHGGYSVPLSWSILQHPDPGWLFHYYSRMLQNELLATWSHPIEQVDHAHNNVTDRLPAHLRHPPWMDLKRGRAFSCHFFNRFTTYLLASQMNERRHCCSLLQTIGL